MTQEEFLKRAGMNENDVVIFHEGELYSSCLNGNYAIAEAQGESGQPVYYFGKDELKNFIDKEKLYSPDKNIYEDGEIVGQKTNKNEMYYTEASSGYEIISLADVEANRGSIELDGPHYRTYAMKVGDAFSRDIERKLMVQVLLED